MKLSNIVIIFAAGVLSACASTETAQEVAAKIDENRFEITVPMGSSEPRDRAEAKISEMAQLFCADNQGAMATDFEYEDNPLYTLNSGRMCGATACPTARTLQVMRLNGQFSCS